MQSTSSPYYGVLGTKRDHRSHAGSIQLPIPFPRPPPRLFLSLGMIDFAGKRLTWSNINGRKISGLPYRNLHQGGVGSARSERFPGAAGPAASSYSGIGRFQNNQMIVSRPTQKDRKKEKKKTKTRRGKAKKRDRKRVGFYLFILWFLAVLSFFFCVFFVFCSLSPLRLDSTLSQDSRLTIPELIIPSAVSVRPEWYPFSFTQVAVGAIQADETCHTLTNQYVFDVHTLPWSVPGALSRTKEKKTKVPLWRLQKGIDRNDAASCIPRIVSPVNRNPLVGHRHRIPRQPGSEFRRTPVYRDDMQCGWLIIQIAKFKHAA